MSDTVRLVALNAAFVAAGIAIVHLAGIPGGRAWRATLVGLAPAAGIAASGLAAVIAAMTGLGLGLASTAVLVLLGAAGTHLILRGRRPGVGTLSAPRSGGVVARIAELVALVLLGIVSLAVLRLYAATDLDQWDGWAMWAPKAHALFVEGDVWGPVFGDPAYVMQHQEYPILFPSLEALSADALGRFDRVLIDIEPAVVLLSFGWAAWALLRLVVAPWLAAGVALGLTGSVHLIDNGAGNYADSVVASFTALGLLCAFVWLSRGATATLALSALFFAAAASTKVEGLLFALAAIAAVLATARGFGRSLRPASWFAAAVLAVPASWAVVDRLNGPGAKNVDRATLTEPGAMLDAAGRVPTASWRLLTEGVDGWRLACAWIVAAIVGACLARLWWHVAFVVLWATLSFVALVGVYYANVAPIDWLLGTSADRVVLSLVLGLATTAPVLVGAVRREQLADRPVGHAEKPTSEPLRPPVRTASRIAP
jgi:hypothetical protein